MHHHGINAHPNIPFAPQTGRKRVDKPGGGPDLEVGGAPLQDFKNEISDSMGYREGPPKNCPDQ
jgi:hypothetical protein